MTPMVYLIKLAGYGQSWQAQSPEEVLKRVMQWMAEGAVGELRIRALFDEAKWPMGKVIPFPATAASA